jgi:hypothetical protein
MAVDINGDGLIALGGTSTTQGRLRLAEDTDNGTNYIELTANAAVTTNRTVTFPDADINFTTGLGAAQGGTGATTLTAENVVIGNGTSSVKFVAPGTTGNVLTSNGSAWLSQAAAAGGGDYIMQVFTTPGTWTKPAGLKAIKVTVIGGGGGFASPPSPATVGGTSSFGSPAFLSATGGGAGVQGAGGAGSGGQLNASGMRGFSPQQSLPGCGTFVGAIGGSSAFGFAQGNPSVGAPLAGLAYGGGAANNALAAGGGGGAIEYIDAPALPGPQPYTVGAGGSGSPGGAAGGAGVIIVEEFY